MRKGYFVVSRVTLIGKNPPSAVGVSICTLDLCVTSVICCSCFLSLDMHMELGSLFSFTFVFFISLNDAV
jgi:hypothetical protein